jgi:aconitate decarboxylase
MVEPGFAIKMFPSQYATHFGITAGLELHERIADPSAIKSVTIIMPIMPYVNRPYPRTGLDGKFSFQYTVAAALLDGAVTVQTFTDARRFRPAMERMLGVIALNQTDTIPGEMEKMWVDVEVELKNGQRLSARCRGPRGFWGLPPLTREDHLTKVHDCLQARLSSEETEQVIRLAETLDKLESDGIRELMTIIEKEGGGSHGSFTLCYS